MQRRLTMTLAFLLAGVLAAAGPAAPQERWTTSLLNPASDPAGIVAETRQLVPEGLPG